MNGTYVKSPHRREKLIPGGEKVGIHSALNHLLQVTSSTVHPVNGCSTACSDCTSRSTTPPMTLLSLSLRTVTLRLSLLPLSLHVSLLVWILALFPQGGGVFTLYEQRECMWYILPCRMRFLRGSWVVLRNHWQLIKKRVFINLWSNISLVLVTLGDVLLSLSGLQILIKTYLTIE